MTRQLLFFSLVSALLTVPAWGSGAKITAVTTLEADGGRVDWSNDNRIAFDRRGSDGYFDVWIVNPNGSGERCLTCDKPGLPGRHAGNPAFHPTGRFIVFQAQKLFLGQNSSTDDSANPGAGYYNDVWVMDDQGTKFWRMTDIVALAGGGVLHPKFSHKGDKMMWAERVDTTPLSSFGTWAVKLADFSISPAGVPSISNIRTYQPGVQKGFMETHDFSEDDSKIYYSANSESGQPLVGMDEFMLDWQTGAVTNLTQTPNQWDEHGHLSPAGNHLAWTTSSGLGGTPVFTDLKLELWLMNLDGTNKERISFFTDPTWSLYQPGVNLISDFDWSPDGTKIVAYLVESVTDVKGRIAILDLDFTGIIVNAASFTAQSFAPESIITMFGRGFTTSANPSNYGTQAYGQSTATPPPTSLGGSTAQIVDSTGRITDLQMFYASPAQMNLYVPKGVAPGAGTVNIKIDGTVVSSSKVQVANVSPGVFTVSQDGRGVALAGVVRVNQDGSQTYLLSYTCDNSGCRQNPIDFTNAQNIALILYGTGIRNGGTVTATVGGVPAQVLFSGDQRQYSGLDQVNLLLPRTLIGRGTVDVVLNVNGISSNSVQIVVR